MNLKAIEESESKHETLTFCDLDVFVLTYNRARCLAIMLESLCCQTAQGFHIIVLNNASTDNTLEVIDKIRGDYPDRDIQVITSNENIGNIGNFRLSQALAKNKYTAVFHDDDAIHPEYIETAMNLFAQHPDAVVCTGNVHPVYNVKNCNWNILNKDYFLYPASQGVYFQILYSRLVFQTVIYKTEIYKSLTFEYEKYGKLHDNIFLMEVSQMGPSILILDACGRVGVSPKQDSNNLNSGPFPLEIYNIVKYIFDQIKSTKHAKPLLWNFAYFLYNWSYLSRFESWKVFCSRMKNEIFTVNEMKIYSFCFERWSSFFARIKNKNFTRDDVKILVAKIYMYIANKSTQRHAKNVFKKEHVLHKYDNSIRCGLNL